MWTDEEIMTIIKCKKIITRKPKNEFVYSNRQWRNDCGAKSIDEKYSFTIFMRYLDDMHEDFSVGLRIETPNPFLNRPLILTRYQGPHGGFVENQITDDPHNTYHIHILAASDVNNKIYAAKKKIIDTDYSNIFEAISSFCLFCNIEDGEQILLKGHNNNQIVGQMTYLE